MSEEMMRLLPFASLAPVASRVWGTVDQPSAGAEWPGAPEGLVDRFAVVLEGAILIPSAGRCKFALESDDGSRLWIDGKEETITHCCCDANKRDNASSQNNGGR